jgi:hypothetical protein
VKQEPTTQECTENLEVNALFPQQLAYLAGEPDPRVRLID